MKCLHIEFDLLYPDTGIQADELESTVQWALDDTLASYIERVNYRSHHKSVDDNAS